MSGAERGHPAAARAVARAALRELLGAAAGTGHPRAAAPQPFLPQVTVEPGQLGIAEAGEVSHVTNTNRHNLNCVLLRAADLPLCLD